MKGVVDELTWALPDAAQVVRITVRLAAALLIGTAIGLQRELTHKPAGLRTHMLVALGTALFIVAANEAGLGTDALSRVMQGLATGIGFLGAGAILKLGTEREIHGLTTAAGIWTTAAASAAAAVGQVTVALIGTFLGLLVLVVFRRVERAFNSLARRDAANRSNHSSHDPKDIA